MIRVIVADDHRIVREGVMRLLADARDLNVVAEATSGPETLAALERHPADVLVLDVAMPGKVFLELLAEVRAGWPATHVVVLSAYAEEEYAVRAFRAGASGYVTKERSPAELITAIRTAMSGGRFVTATLAEHLAAAAAGDVSGSAHDQLSDREHEVLQLIGAGNSVKEIAAQLGLSAKTVSTYRTRLREKLRLHGTAELIRYAVERRLPG